MNSLPDLTMAMHYECMHALLLLWAHVMFALMQGQRSPTLGNCQGSKTIKLAPSGASALGPCFFSTLLQHLCWSVCG
jgi:hypothetical protein